MRNDRHLAIQLRKKGASYNKILKELGIPKSTMAYWFRDEEWSKEIKDRLNKKNNFIAKKRLRAYIKIRRERLDNFYKQCRENAKEEFPALKNNPLFSAGLMLYWGEGDSNIKNCCVRLANSDPKMIALFFKFLKEIAKIPEEKIKLHLILYPDLDDKTCKEFWNQKTGIKIEQFIKSSYIQGRHPTKKLTNGIAIIYLGNRGFKEKLFAWTELFQQEFNL